MTPKEENEKYNLPCPHNKKVNCVQFPEADKDKCGCDFCEECEVKMNAEKPK